MASPISIPKGFKLGHVEMTNAEYHGSPGVSKSHLDVVQRSPLHYWQAYINPEREPRVMTPAFLLGSAIHSAILEPDLFPKEYVMVPEDAPKRPTDRQIGAKKPSPETLEAIAFWEEFDAEAEGRTLLTPDQYRVALGARDSVLRNPAAMKYLKRGKPEQTYFAMDADTGALVKARADWVIHGGGILDVKSTEDASPDGFIKSVLTYRYHVQQPWYQDVIEAALDRSIRKHWYFLAVEKRPPYACAVYTLPAELVAAGRIAARQNLQSIVDGWTMESWPGYSSAVTELACPGWARKKYDVDSAEADFAGT